jgi:alkylresorcinol/alkylpyrone synthase
MAASIVSVAIAVPDICIHQADIKEAVRHMFGSNVPHLERLLTIFEHSDIETRHFCMPLEWFLVPHTVEEKHRLFIQHATDLAERVVQDCLAKAGVAPSDIDHILFITTTGTVTPSIDAYLCNRLAFRPNLKRTPIWGLGCAGGAAGLSRASEYVTAFPAQNCLLVSVELCSLTFIRDDASKSNIVATSLFADGAAAALVVGEQNVVAIRSDQPAPSIVSTQSMIWPDSLDVMGWDVTNEGLMVIFSKSIPALVTDTMKGNVSMLLEPQGLDTTDLRHYILHPGGMKVLRAYEEALSIQQGGLAAAENVLRSYGNMSSCTVLFVLDEILRADRPPSAGEYGLAGALGPGFSSELLLLQF